MKKYFLIILFLPLLASGCGQIDYGNINTVDQSGNISSNKSAHDNLQIKPVPQTSAPIEDKSENKSVRAKYDQLILGTWNRIEVPSQTIIYLTDHTAEVRYDNKLASKFDWSIQGSTIFESDKGGKRRYEITKLDKNTLELYYPYAKKTLHYKRVE